MSRTDPRVAESLAWLERRGSDRAVTDMATRYGIRTKKAFGVSVADIKQLSKRLGQDHQLAGSLWKTGWHEARMVCAFVADPEKVTPAEMDRWVRDFDNWGIVDTLCFHLWDRTPHAWGRINAWAKRKEEFVKRASFALLASVALHDKKAPDAPFINSLSLIERAATDERNFVWKGVSWALRGIGRRGGAVRTAAKQTAAKLAASDDPTARRIGKEASREFARLKK